jgi:hypothetical protein
MKAIAALAILIASGVAVGLGGLWLYSPPAAEHALAQITLHGWPTSLPTQHKVADGGGGM